jgi:hypothetical protein
LSSFGFLKELGPRPSSSCQPVFLASSQWSWTSDPIYYPCSA